MQVLYVTEFVVEPSEADATLDTAIDDLLSLLGEWVGGRHPIAAADLLADGLRELDPTHDSVRKHAEWSHVSAAPDWATRVEVRTVAADEVEFVARVTVGRVEDSLRVRVSLAREVPSGHLAPARQAEVHQPGVISELVRRPGLRVCVANQGTQDGRYIQARGEQQVKVVAEILGAQDRLPVLLVHTRTEEAISAVRRAASGLVGLARVVTLDLRSVRLLHDLEPRADVPYAGGLLVWADIEAPALEVAASVVSSRNPDDLRYFLMEQIAPLSVLARGVDDTYRAVQQRAQEARATAAAERTAAAVESGSQSDIIEALKHERDQARDAEKLAVSLWEQGERANQGMRKEAARWKAEAEQLRIAARYVASDEATIAKPGWENAPELATADTGSLSALCEHLEQAAQGRIVFTPNAIKAWKKADRYPTPGEMRTSLVQLAKLAHDLYDGQERTVGYVDDWARANYGLKMPLQDDQMPKKFQTFEYEGKQYERIPHVKVNDGVPHHECGRIYFAFDKANQRMIVDHVGLKW